MVSVFGNAKVVPRRRRTREGVQGVRESQGRRARQGAGCTERTCTVRFVEGLIVDAGIAEGVGVTVGTASSHCAGRY